MRSKLASLALVFDTKGGGNPHYSGFLTSDRIGVSARPHYPGRLISAGIVFSGDAKLIRFARRLGL